MLRYTNETNLAGVRPRYAPTHDENVAGRYVVSGTTISFVTDRVKGKKERTLEGTIAGGQITLTFNYVNGKTTRRYVVVLRKYRDW